MKPLRRLTNLPAAYTVAAATFGQPALAARLAKDPFITDNAQRQHFEPGGKYHLFGNPRGSVASRMGKIDVTQAYAHQMGNPLIQQASINDIIGYHTRSSGHGREVHTPFDNHASHSASEGKDSVNEDFTVHYLNWERHECYPADSYDGLRSGNYSKPTGVRDEYTYNVNGVARSIKLNPTDTRGIRQHIFDDYSSLDSDSPDHTYEANREMFEHNSKLGRWGNNMELINGAAVGTLNPFLSTNEILGIDDMLHGVGYAIDKATIYGISLLSADGKLAATGGLGGVTGSEENTREAADRWMQGNPNAVETAEVAFNVAAAVKAAELTKATKSRKAAVSGDFSKSYTCSLHGNALVKAAGGYKTIAHIRVNNHVFAKDEASEKTGYKPATTRYSNPCQETAYIEVSDGLGKIQTLVSNRIRPFYSDGKWIEAEDSKVGNRLSSESDTERTVQSITVKPELL